MSGRVSDVWKQREREIAALVHGLLGKETRRKLGAGRKDDVGDLDSLPQWTMQVAAWKDVARAAREKPVEAELQRRNAGTPFAVTFVRFRGVNGSAPPQWRAVMTLEQWAAVVRETLPDASGCIDSSGSGVLHLEHDDERGMGSHDRGRFPGDRNARVDEVADRAADSA